MAEEWTSEDQAIYTAALPTIRKKKRIERAKQRTAKGRKIEYRQRPNTRLTDRNKESSKC